VWTRGGVNIVSHPDAIWKVDGCAVEVKTSESINIPGVLNVVKKLILALRMEKQHIIRSFSPFLAFIFFLNICVYSLKDYLCRG